MHAVLNTWRTTEFYFLIKLFTFTRNVLASPPVEVQSCLFSLTQENACGSCRQRNTALCSAAAYRPRSAPAPLPPVTAFVGQVSSYTAFAFAVALPPVGGTIKKVQARISLCTLPRFNNTCI